MAKQKNERVAEMLAPLKAKLEAQRAEILAKSAPLHERREALVAQIAPLEAELRRVNAEIKAVEQPALRDIGNELASIARAIGATSLKAE